MRVEQYTDIVDEMDKLELLEEMVRFQEYKAKNLKLSEEYILRGLALFKNLILTAETNELKKLTQNYHSFLEKELVNVRTNGVSGPNTA